MALFHRYPIKNLDQFFEKITDMVMAGKLDCLRAPGYTDAFVPKIPRASLHVFEKAGDPLNALLMTETACNCAPIGSRASITPTAR